MEKTTEASVKLFEDEASANITSILLQALGNPPDEGQESVNQSLSAKTCIGSPGWPSWVGYGMVLVGFACVAVSCFATHLIRRAQRMKTIVNAALMSQSSMAAVSVGISCGLDALLFSFDCTYFSYGYRVALCRISFVVYLFSMCHYFYATSMTALYRVICTAWSSILLGVCDTKQRMIAICPPLLAALITSGCALYKAYKHHPFIIKCTYGIEPHAKEPSFFKVCLIVIPIVSEVGTMLLYSYIVYESSKGNNTRIQGNRHRSFNMVTARASMIHSLMMSAFCIHPTIVAMMQNGIITVNVSVVVIRVSTHVVQGIIGPIMMVVLSSELRKCALDCLSSDNMFISRISSLNHVLVYIQESISKNNNQSNSLAASANKQSFNDNRDQNPMGKICLVTPTSMKGGNSPSNDTCLREPYTLAAANMTNPRQSSYDQYPAQNCVDQIQVIQQSVLALQVQSSCLKEISGHTYPQHNRDLTNGTEPKQIPEQNKTSKKNDQGEKEGKNKVEAGIGFLDDTNEKTAVSIIGRCRIIQEDDSLSMPEISE